MNNQPQRPPIKPPVPAPVGGISPDDLRDICPPGYGDLQEMAKIAARAIEIAEQLAEMAREHPRGYRA